MSSTVLSQLHPRHVSERHRRAVGATEAGTMPHKYSTRVFFCALLLTIGLHARGDLSFLGPLKLPATAARSRSDALALADFNGDGKLDLAVLAAPLQILLGRGDGSFQSSGQSPQPVGPQGEDYACLLAADFDRDGKMDLAWLGNPTESSPTSPRIAVAYGAGGSYFAMGSLISARNQQGWLNRQLAVGDLNGDGWPDLAVSNAYASTSAGIEIWLNVRGRGFTLYPAPLNLSPIGWPTPNHGAPVIGDFTGDGIADVVASAGSFIDLYPSRLLLFRGNGDGSFQSATAIITGLPDMSAMSGIDLNGDGRLDLVAAGGDGVWVLLNNNNGKFLAPQPYSTGMSASSIAFADFDGDGRADIAVGHGTPGSASGFAAMPGSGSGWFGDLLRVSLDQRATEGMVIGDINGDGKPDAVVAYGPSADDGGTVATLINNGTPAIRLRNLTVSPTTVVGSQSVKVGVTITQKAPPGGFVISLASAHPALSVPPSITIPAKSTSATVNVPAAMVTSVLTGTVSGTAGGVTVSKDLTVRPIGPTSVTLDQTTVKVGGVVSGQVVLELPAAPGNVTVTLAASKTGSVTFTPVAVVVPAGTTTGTFSLKANAVKATTTVSIKATAGSVTKSATLTITP